MEPFLKSKTEIPGEFSEIGQTGSTAGNERNRMMNETCQMFCRDEDVVQRRIGNDVVLVPITHQFGDLENIFALNDTAAYIWQQIDGQRSFAEIYRLVASQYDIAEDVARSDVADYLRELELSGLIHGAARQTPAP
jgi:hypothetical protein